MFLLHLCVCRARLGIGLGQFILDESEKHYRLIFRNCLKLYKKFLLKMFENSNIFAFVELDLEFDSGNSYWTSQKSITVWYSDNGKKFIKIPLLKCQKIQLLRVRRVRLGICPNTPPVTVTVVLERQNTKKVKTFNVKSEQSL